MSLKGNIAAILHVYGWFEFNAIEWGDFFKGI